MTDFNYRQRPTTDAYREGIDRIFNRCATTDTQGNHCPGKPTHTIEEIKLCEECFKGYEKRKHGRRKNAPE